MSFKEQETHSENNHADSKVAVADQPLEGQQALDVPSREQPIDCDALDESNYYREGVGGLSMRALPSGVAYDLLREDDPNARMMKKIMSKLSFSMAIGTNEARPGHSFLVLENPGTLLDPSLDTRKTADLARLADLLNVIPNPNWVWEESSGRVDKIYDMTLRDKELPIHELTQEQKRILRRARKTVRKYIDDYDRYMAAYWEAHDEYYSAWETAQNSGDELNPIYRRRLETAERRWVSLGYKLEVENAQATIFNLNSLDPNPYWAGLVAQRNAAERTYSAGSFLETRMNPSYAAVMDSSKRWTRFSFREADWEYQREHSHVRTGGGVSAHFGLWRASGSATYERDEGYQRSESNQIFIDAEIRRVSIMRPWLDGMIYRSRAWRWHPRTQGSSNLVSDGRPLATAMPTGWMPLLPVGVLLARKVRIKADFSESERRWLREKTTAGASFGWGPFSFSGKYEKTHERDFSSGSFVGNTIENDDVQIIGWFCDVLPRSPDPDPSLRWPSHLTIADYQPSNYVDSLRVNRDMMRMGNYDLEADDWDEPETADSEEEKND